VESLPSKRRILKREREKEREKKDRKMKIKIKEKGLKSKKGETSYEEAPCSKTRKEKKKRIKFTCCWERFYRKKERK
jgi:hypothetical protein